MVRPLVHLSTRRSARPPLAPTARCRHAARLFFARDASSVRRSRPAGGGVGTDIVRLFRELATRSRMVERRRLRYAVEGNVSRLLANQE